MTCRLRWMVIALLVAVPSLVNAANTGAVGSGDWSNAATWTNGVPGASDRAFIGEGYPTGVGINATVTLSQNSSASYVYMGSTNGTAAIDLGGFTLSTGFLGIGLGSSDKGSILRTGGGSLSIGEISLLAGSISLIPGDTTVGLEMGNGATASTAATSNVTSVVIVDRGNSANGITSLTMGADLSLSANLQVGGILNAGGHAIAAQTIFMGDQTGIANLQNDGLITAGTWNQTFGGLINLHHPGDALGTILLANNALLDVSDGAGQTSGLTLGDSASSNLSITSGGRLKLELNGLADGWVFRWADPSGGDHIADLQNFINAGEITFSSLNGGSYSLSSDGTYTYVNVIPVPEPSSLTLLGVAGIGLARLRRQPRPIV
jgi:hypothetical protein